MQTKGFVVVIINSTPDNKTHFTRELTREAEEFLDQGIDSQRNLSIKGEKEKNPAPDCCSNV